MGARFRGRRAWGVAACMCGLLASACRFPVDVPWDEIPATLSIGQTVVARAGHQEITVDWSDVSDAQRYNVYFAQDPALAVDNYDTLAGGGRAADVTQPFVLEDLQPDETWYFLLEWENAEGTGPATPVVAATTLLSDLLPADVLQSAGTGTTAGQAFGTSVAPIGDYDGDGFEDMLVGSPGFSSDTGRITFLSGGPTGPSPTRTIDGPSVGSRFGISVLRAGDLDGDGLDDVVIGAPEDGATNVGSIWVLWGRSQFDVGDVQGLNGPTVDGNLGYTLVVSGDFTGDAIDDVLVGAPALTDPAVQGSPVIIHGGSGGLSGSGTPIPALAGPGTAAASVLSAIPGLQSGSFFYLVGAPQDTASTGLVAIAETIGGGITFSNDRAGTTAGDEYGSLVQFLECNGDTHPDVLIGAAGIDTVYLFAGELNVTATVTDAAVPVWSYTGPAGSRLGTSVAVLDANGDGLDDVLLGAPGAGEAYLFLGNATDGLEATPVRTFVGNAADELGAMTAVVDDVTGDGSPDLIFGAPAAATGTGELHLVAGPPTTTPSLAAGGLTVSGNTAQLTGFDFVTRTDASYACQVVWGDGTTDDISVCTPADLEGLQHAFSGASVNRIRVRVEITDAKALWGTDASVITEAAVELGLP